jgi:N-acetylglucosamine kinase-like BadF-type ATPase
LDLQHDLLLVLEGGGTRSQAVLMDFQGHVLQASTSSAVNTNFVPFEQAQQAVLTAVKQVIQTAGVQGQDVTYFVSSLIGPRFGAETFGEFCPKALYQYYGERSVIFAQAGIFHPHGVGIVAATGATTWAVRADDGRQVTLGGWGALLGDEGSAYAMGLLGLRASAKAYENRSPAPTALVEAISQHFNINKEDFNRALVHLAYQKPLSRAEVASVAKVVTRLASQGDPMALRITSKVVNDLSELALCGARRLFSPAESFDVVAAGGLVKAGELILAPFREKILAEFPLVKIQTGTEVPVIALGRLALHNIQEETC